MFKNTSGQKIALFAFILATGAPKTGDAANLTAYVSKDFGTVTVLGDTSATEMDATNAPGWYLFDLTQGESNFDFGLFTGKSSTSGVSVVGRPIDSVPNRFTTMVIDAAGLVDANAVKVGPSGSGTAQTAGDIPARLPAALVSGRIDASVGAMAANVLTATAIAADAITDAKVASDVTIASVTGAVGSVTGAVGSVTGAVGSVTGLTASDVGAIKAKTDNLPSDPADASDIAGAFSTVNSTLSTIAGYVDTEVAAIKAKTDLIPASPAAVSDIPTAAAVSDAVWDEILSGHAGVGSTGAALSAAGGSGDPWATALPGSYGSGTAGKIIGDNINASISSVKAKTDNLPSDPADASDIIAAVAALPTADENADALLNRDMSAVSDTNDRTPLNALRFLRNRWDLSGATLTVKKENDTTTAWTATVATSPGADPISGSDPA